MFKNIPALCCRTVIETRFCKVKWSYLDELECIALSIKAINSHDPRTSPDSLTVHASALHLTPLSFLRKMFQGVASERKARQVRELEVEPSKRYILLIDTRNKPSCFDEKSPTTT
jgi:hypothetical protein